MEFTEENLRMHLEKSNFELYYQPVVSAANPLDVKLMGFEALIRLHHKGTMRSPLDFLPAVSRFNLEIEVGAWVMQEALMRTKSWYDFGVFDCKRVGINISEKQFSDTSLAVTLQTALRKADIAPKTVHVEISEDAIFHDIPAVMQVVALRELGVTVVLDDLGTQGAHLDVLARLDVDVVKIDRKYISYCHTKRGAVILDALIRVVHGLEMKVIAEGVETPQQAQFLRDHGCDMMQGYYFAEPMSAGNATNYLLDHDLKRKVA